MLNFVIPVIEQLASGDFRQMNPVILEQIHERRMIAKAVKTTLIQERKANIIPLLLGFLRKMIMKGYYSIFRYLI